MKEGRPQPLSRLPLLPNANPKQSGVAAFVQNRATGEVLHALMLPVCGGGDVLVSVHQLS
ncbi:MAG: hypothetical protein EXR29_01000 [Betaproteobacteria bacterium]|nr:hypothetical protein [Betaproteobacteria bacterium]